ncbi:hypothetical protein CGMCC3_g3390 [Colletotrichum fructicola]|nr:uncharacterized protein CGMCC3_g3390 [Colletotrichum fructicola]KAE9580748.1 hypothetical protein CGMCC3_g3390 [Colletotrichum fructicola]
MIKPVEGPPMFRKANWGSRSGDEFDGEAAAAANANVEVFVYNACCSSVRLPASSARRQPGRFD